MGKTYSTETKYGTLVMNRNLKPREHSGQVGLINFTLHYNQHEIKQICDKLNIAIADKTTIENAMFESVAGVKREVKVLPQATATAKGDSLAVHKEVIKTAIDSGDVNAGNFDARLKAYADATKLTTDETKALKDAFPLSQPKKEETIVF